MTKFDDERLKRRRAISLEDIQEEEDSWIAEDNLNNKNKNAFNYDDNDQEALDREQLLQRRYSYPLLPSLQRDFI